MIIFIFLFLNGLVGFMNTTVATNNFKVTRDMKNNYIYLDPLEGEPQQTFIFLHGLL